MYLCVRFITVKETISKTTIKCLVCILYRPLKLCTIFNDIDKCLMNNLFVQQAFSHYYAISSVMKPSTIFNYFMNIYLRSLYAM